MQRTRAAAGPILVRKESNDITDNARDEMPRKQHQAPQPPLSHPTAAPGSDRASKPPLGKGPSTDRKLVPGDRVEANFGKPSGVVGAVEQANENDAVVKWDYDGRIELRQPGLKNV